MFPQAEPYESGSLETAGASLYWEQSGDPAGRAALYLHGGPGSGLRHGWYRTWFDPSVFRTVGLDQRGCGRSRPLAVDALDSLGENTTQRLIRDIEALRAHLGIDRWLVVGVSWGSTLALAYAESHPERVDGLALLAVTSTSREEVDWITDGVARLFPEAWARLHAAAPPLPGERVVEAVARCLRSEEPAVREAAAAVWAEWEATIVSLDPGFEPSPVVAARNVAARNVVARNKATLVTHYWANDAFLGPTGILDAIAALRPVPAVLIHGRRDVGSPLVTAWRLHRSWPGSSLRVVEDEGHGGPRMWELLVEAIAELGQR
ncbi:prolyl aminopeptidase [Promicromonospora sp. NPDC023987]|uniref:prolyl aminopeptidase n=1 Tax=Promicromonospora sp. NPDC023987 TaxID=3155360 RepID=UPI0033CDD5DF